jgi:hypothetical protein
MLQHRQALVHQVLQNHDRLHTQNYRYPLVLADPQGPPPRRKHPPQHKLVQQALFAPLWTYHPLLHALKRLTTMLLLLH